MTASAPNLFLGDFTPIAECLEVHRAVAFGRVDVVSHIHMVTGHPRRALLKNRRDPVEIQAGSEAAVLLKPDRLSLPSHIPFLLGRCRYVRLDLTLAPIYRDKPRRCPLVLLCLGKDFRELLTRVFIMV